MGQACNLNWEKKMFCSSLVPFTCVFSDSQWKRGELLLTKSNQWFLLICIYRGEWDWVDGPKASGRIYKEILRNRLMQLRMVVEPVVLSMAPIETFNRCMVWNWTELFSLSLLRVSLVKTNEWEGAFFWTIVVSNLFCMWDIENEKKIKLSGNPRPGLK